MQISSCSLFVSFFVFFSPSFLWVCTSSSLLSKFEWKFTVYIFLSAGRPLGDIQNFITFEPNFSLDALRSLKQFENIIIQHNDFFLSRLTSLSFHILNFPARSLFKWNILKYVYVQVFFSYFELLNKGCEVRKQ